MKHNTKPTPTRKASRTTSIILLEKTLKAIADGYSKTAIAKSVSRFEIQHNAKLCCSLDLLIKSDRTRETMYLLLDIYRERSSAKLRAVNKKFTGIGAIAPMMDHRLFRANLVKMVLENYRLGGNHKDFVLDLETATKMFGC